MADGIPNRVDRNTGLGNAIVPQIAMNIGLTIKRNDLDMLYNNDFGHDLLVGQVAEQFLGDLLQNKRLK